MSSIKKQFGLRVRKLRLAANLTQEQLATMSQISVDFLSLIERGKNAPSFATLEKISEALAITVKELFDFNDLGT